MSDFKLALTYLLSRMLITVLTVASVALGLGLATIVLILSQQTQKALSTETGYWDMVVGAKGSPLQLVLNGVYFLDAPTGNIEASVWEHLKDDPMVEQVLPLTMGDNYYGWPIVGTEPAFFDGRTARGGGKILADGQFFTKPFEAVVGAEVAARQHIKLDQKIVSAHGWGKSDDLHLDAPFTVVGILAPTGGSLDRAVFTHYHSTWEVHEHHDEEEAHGDALEDHDKHAHEHEHEASSEVTALLVKLNQPGGRFQMTREINEHQMAMAAIPVDEISKVASTFIAPMQGVLLLVAYLVVLVSALSILISLYLTIYQRRRDMAIMRSLGATRGDIFRLITLEAAILSGFGVALGWLFGHGILAALAQTIFTRFGIYIAAMDIQPVELVIAISVWALGILAGLLPAIMAYRLPVAETLVRE